MAKGSWKRSCPPVVISDCNQNLSTPWISESKNGLASEDPLSQSTVCNGIQGDYHYGVTSENQTEHVSLYYPIQQVGFPRISLSLQGTKQGRLLGHIKIQTRRVSGTNGAAAAAMPPLLQRPRQAAPLPPPRHSV
jgi:hypothetical protein